MADVAHEENVIEHDERTFIHSIIDFGDTVAREVMTPRPDMVTVEGDVTVRDALEAALGAGLQPHPGGGGRDRRHHRHRLRQGPRARRAGRARPAQPVRDSMRPAKFIPESKEVSDLLREMQEEKFHMAIVVDEYGGTAGLDHPRGPARGARGRHRRRVRRGGAHGRALRRTARCSSSALYSVDDADELLGAELPHGHLGHRGRAHARPGRAGARPGRLGRGRRLPAHRASTCGAGASGGSGSSRPARADADVDGERRRRGQRVAQRS